MKTWPGWLDQEREQLERLGLDRDHPAVAQDPVTGQVDLDVAEVDRGRWLALGHAALRPPEQGPDPGDELTQAERLRHVVVGAELEADDLVDLRVLGGEHEDRDRGFGPDDPADLDAGQLGEHQVEHDEVGPIGPEADQGLAAIRRGDDREPLRLEAVGEGLAKRRLVVDDEDRACHRVEW